MIPAYSPQGRGGGERNFQTWQGRLPQELRLRGLRTIEAANRFLNQSYIREFNRKFSVAAAEPGTAFVLAVGAGLDRSFSIPQERGGQRDNTGRWVKNSGEVEKKTSAGTFAGGVGTAYQNPER